VETCFKAIDTLLGFVSNGGEWQNVKRLELPPAAELASIACRIERGLPAATAAHDRSAAGTDTGGLDNTIHRAQAQT
jgi:hypothetical protein